MSLWRHAAVGDIKSLGRFWVIVETIAAYGFNELAGQIKHVRPWKRRSPAAAATVSRPEKLRMLLEELGPTFVKLGQILSTRPDLIGHVYADELSHLTESVSPFPYEEVEKIITAELGGPPEEFFKEFSREPLGAASIGQVHYARLRKNGEAVVVKVQRPGIQSKIALDIEIMRYLARKLERVNETLARCRPVQVVEEFAYSLNRELDYRVEAGNLMHFTKNMSSDEHLKIPRVYLELTTSRVLTMERIFGDSANKVLESPELVKKYDLRKIAVIGVNSLLSQIFEYGFFHADPHPGNIFLLSGDKLCFIDFGMMGRVSEMERRVFIRTISHLLAGRISLMTDSALRMTTTDEFSGSRDNLERDLGDLVDDNINLPLERISVAEILEKLLEILKHYQLALKPNLYMMAKAIITVEHVGRVFDPELKIVELVKPFIFRMKLRAFDPRPYVRSFFDELGDNMQALETIPKSLRRIVAKLETGDLSLRVEHHRLDDIEQTLYITGERLSRSLLLTAILIGSALIIVAKIPPFWYDIPVIGAVGFVFSGVMSMIVLWEDHRQRKRFLRERMRRKLETAINRRKPE